VSALISFGTGLGGSTLDPKLREEARKGLMGGIPRSREQRLKDLQLLFFAPGNDPSVWWGGWYPESAAPRAAAGQKVPRSVWWPGVKLPTLLVQAEQDTTAPMRPAADIKRELGGTDDIIVLSLPHANHAMLPEQPEAIAALVIAYLKGQREGLQDIINKNIRVPRTQ
jgi:pimeloyl-ACP methyl ester carboxylesterase